jgi:uncharacterized membrane protein
VRIVQKAGYTGWWVLVLIIPILNLIMFLIFAFSDWPMRSGERKVETTA